MATVSSLNLRAKILCTAFEFWHLVFTSVIFYRWLDFGLSPRCPQVVWCHWGEIELFLATLAQDGLAECDQPMKNPWKYLNMAGNWTRAMGRTESEIHSLSHWSIMADRCWFLYNICEEDKLIRTHLLACTILPSSYRGGKSLFMAVPDIPQVLEIPTVPAKLIKSDWVNTWLIDWLVYWKLIN